MKRVKKRKARSARRSWTEGVWVRNLFAVIAIAAVGILTALYFNGKLPELEAYIGRRLATKDDLDQKTTIAGSENRSLVEVVSASQSDTSVIQGHLLASISGNKLTIVNEGVIPIRITRLVRNKRYGVAWCDTDEDVNTDPSKSANFSNRVDQVLMLGESYRGPWSAACGGAGLVEVQTDRGTIAFRLSH